MNKMVDSKIKQIAVKYKNILEKEFSITDYKYVRFWFIH